MFCQVVPEDKWQPWIAGRNGAACGLLSDGTLVTLGGHGSRDIVPNSTLACFAWTPRAAVDLQAGITRQSTHPLSCMFSPFCALTDCGFEGHLSSRHWGSRMFEVMRICFAAQPLQVEVALCCAPLLGYTCSKQDVIDPTNAQCLGVPVQRLPVEL